MENIKVVIHDWDDTVTNSFDTYKEAHFDFSKYHGLEIPTIEKIKKNWGKPILDLYYHIHGIDGGFSIEEIEVMLKKQFENTKKGYLPNIFDGVNETLKYLNKKYVLGVLSSGNSNKIKSLINMHLNKENADAYKFVLCADNCTVHKPNPKVFDFAMEQLSAMNINESNIVYVGDSLIDYEAATNRGMQFIAVTTGVVSIEEFAAEGLDRKYIIEKFSCLKNIL